MTAHHEIKFEDAIEHALLASGWHQGRRDGYRRDLGLDIDQMWTFIGATQNDVGATASRTAASYN